MNVLLISPYLEQKKGPFIWAKNYALTFDKKENNLFILTFEENNSYSNVGYSIYHKGGKIEKKLIPYPYISMVPKIIELEKKYKIDIVQTNDTITAFCANIAKIITKVPVILRVGGEYFNEIKEWSKKETEFIGYDSNLLKYIIVNTFKSIGMASMRNVDKLIAPNIYMKNYLDKFGFESEIINNGVSVKEFQIEGVIEKDNSLLTIANMDIPRKVDGLKILLNAMYYLKKDIPGITLKIAGDGVYKSDIESYTKELSLCENVEFLGYTNNIPILLKESTIYVHSSLQDVFPNSILEAMASKRAVVAINIGGICEIVKTNYNGILCNPTCESLTENICTLLKNKSLRDSIALNGYSIVNNLYSWEVVIKQYISLYSSIVSQKY